MFLEDEMGNYIDDMGEVEDYDEDLHEPWPSKKTGPDIIDAMKPTFYFNVKGTPEDQRRQESLDSRGGVSQTPCFVNTPSNSS